VERSRLTSALATLQRISVPCAGVVLSRSRDRALAGG
jgi:hypothetical protein